MDISVVIPLYNEAESLPELFSWIERVMKEHNYTYEVIFVNDGSTDNSWEVIEELKQRSPHVRGIKFRRNYGKSPGDTRTLPDDHRRRVRSGIRLEKEKI